MAALQGLKRLLRGVTRELTESERARGYIFISRDKEVKKILGKKFDFKIGADTYKQRSIDGSGRLYIGKTKSVGRHDVVIRLVDGKLVIE